MPHERVLQDLADAWAYLKRGKQNTAFVVVKPKKARIPPWIIMDKASAVRQKHKKSYLGVGSDDYLVNQTVAGSIARVKRKVVFLTEEDGDVDTLGKWVAKGASAMNRVARDAGEHGGSIKKLAAVLRTAEVHAATGFSEDDVEELEVSTWEVDTKVEVYVSLPRKAWVTGKVTAVSDSAIEVTYPTIDAEKQTVSLRVDSQQIRAYAGDWGYSIGDAVEAVVSAGWVPATVKAVKERIEVETGDGRTYKLANAYVRSSAVLAREAEALPPLEDDEIAAIFDEDAEAVTNAVDIAGALLSELDTDQFEDEAARRAHYVRVAQEMIDAGDTSPEDLRQALVDANYGRQLVGTSELSEGQALDAEMLLFVMGTPLPGTAPLIMLGQARLAWEQAGDIVRRTLRSHSQKTGAAVGDDDLGDDVSDGFTDLFDQFRSDLDEVVAVLRDGTVEPRAFNAVRRSFAGLKDAIHTDPLLVLLEENPDSSYLPRNVLETALDNVYDRLEAAWNE